MSEGTQKAGVHSYLTRKSFNLESLAKVESGYEESFGIICSEEGWPPLWSAAARRRFVASENLDNASVTVTKRRRAAALQRGGHPS